MPKRVESLDACSCGEGDGWCCRRRLVGDGECDGRRVFVCGSIDRGDHGHDLVLRRWERECAMTLLVLIAVVARWM